MPQPIPALTLLAAQTRMINATEGFRLEVQSGCLWLTRPSDSVDRFLVAGSSIELHENGVLIQSDRHPGDPGLQTARFTLTPVPVPQPKVTSATSLPRPALSLGLGRISAAIAAIQRPYFGFIGAPR